MKSTKISKSSRRSQWVVVAFLILFAIVAIYFTTLFKKMPPILKRGIQPSDFPQLICGLIIFLALLMAWLEPIKLEERATRMTWFTFVALAGFALLAPIDFFLALGVVPAAMSLLWGERRLHLIGLVGIVIPVSIFFLFDQVFRIRFPHGILTNLWYG